MSTQTEVDKLRYIAGKACEALAHIVDDPAGMEAQALLTEWTSGMGSAGEHAAARAVVEVKALRALLARCVPPEYMVEPAPRSCDKEWVWDSCDDDWNGYGEADSREQALADAWIHWRAREKERADDREEAKDLARFEP